MKSIVGASVAVALTASLPGAASALAPACTQCDKKLDLSEPEWRCLQSRLPKLKLSKTRFVFFSLGGQCAAAPPQRTRNSDTRLPPSTVTASRVFRLTREQLDCVARHAGRIAPSHSRYVLDFAAMCPEALETR